MAGFLDDILGNTASDAALAAGQQVLAGGKRAQTGYDTAAGQFQPYQQAGTGALQQLLAGLGLSGGQGGQAAFTNAYRSMPGYTSGLERGTEAAMRAQNAGPGSLGGTRALQNLYRFGSDYEDQRSGDYLNRLSGLTGAGQQATAGATGLLGKGIDARMGGDTQNALAGIAAAQAQQQASTNLLGTGASLLGSIAGGPIGGSIGGSLGGMFGAKPAGGMGLPMFGGPSRLY